MRRIFLALILSLFAAFSTAAPINSGDYGGLLIGVDQQGTLTGYFESSTKNGQFSCIFFVSGKIGAPMVHVDTWFPADRDPKEVIAGTIEADAETGGNAIRVALKEEHGGCWNVQHFASEPASFRLTEVGTWQAIRVVSAKKAYFYEDSMGARPRKAYVVQGNALRVFEQQSGRVRVEYVSPENKRTRGWISERDLYSAQSPATK
ncbi:hypothetical protein [Rugamonas sp.]|uniref:hypothetical protein n=1 Tax=Rugamonas sp. TaxID=1926287 RepID=UPI0025CF67F2|nr:hypothetical protein [Rugamonas sp.]